MGGNGVSSPSEVRGRGKLEAENRGIITGKMMMMMIVRGKRQRQVRGRGKR